MRRPRSFTALGVDQLEGRVVLSHSSVLHNLKHFGIQVEHAVGIHSPSDSHKAHAVTLAQREAHRASFVAVHGNFLAATK